MHARVGIALDRRTYGGLNSTHFDLPIFIFGHSSLNKLKSSSIVQYKCFFWPVIFDPSIVTLIVSHFPGAS